MTLEMQGSLFLTVILDTQKHQVWCALQSPGHCRSYLSKRNLWSWVGLPCFWMPQCVLRFSLDVQERSPTNTTGRRKSNLTLVGCEHVLGLLTSISGWMAVLWDTSDQRRDPRWQGWISLVDTIASCWTRLSCECCQCLRCHGGRVQFSSPRCNVGSCCPARFKF